jgi:hypothetical protein
MARFRIIFQSTFVYVEVDLKAGRFRVLAPGEPLDGELTRGEGGFRVASGPPGLDPDVVRQIETALNRPPPKPSRPFGAPY